MYQCSLEALHAVNDRGDRTKEEWITELQSPFYIAHTHRAQLFPVPANLSYMHWDRDYATDDEALYSREYAYAFNFSIEISGYSTRAPWKEKG